MSRQWEPGDVALLHGRSGQVLRGVRTTTDEWACQDAHGWEDRDDVVAARPLVVIDPEDREQVECLSAAFLDDGTALPNIRAIDDKMQAALRSLIADPKPEEPKGLGAVVRADDRHWVRADTSLRGWRPTLPNAKWRRWDDFGASVEVLSEGVTQ